MRSSEQIKGKIKYLAKNPYVGEIAFENTLDVLSEIFQKISL